VLHGLEISAQDLITSGEWIADLGTASNSPKGKAVQLVSRRLGHGEGRHLGARGKGSDVVAVRADRGWISRPLLAASEDIQH
jgi:hypothetical protein